MSSKEVSRNPEEAVPETLKYSTRHYFTTMGMILEALLMSSQFLYGMRVPRSWEASAVVLVIYAIHLAISALVLYYSVKITGGKSDFITAFPKALFTVFVRDLIVLPLLLTTAFFPLFGMFIAIVVWLGLIKYIFNLPWTKTVMVFIVSLILPIVVLLFILLPIALFMVAL